MFEVICVSFAFFAGLAARQLGLPPLVGFLAAGFAINATGPMLGLPEETGSILDYVAHLGVEMLLFTVGLKLNFRQITQPQVVGGALAHFGLSVALLMPLLRWILALDWQAALLLTIALSFSSTVLAAKLLEAKRELRAFHGRTAIGILIVQDVIALVVLAIWSDQTPNAFAALLLLLPLLRPVLHRLLDLAGHDELLVLMGMLLALVVGGMGFAGMGLSSELGALVMGVLLSNHTRATELSNALWSLKEVFLVGFFLQIGMSGLPDSRSLLFALGVGLLLPLKGLLFFALLIAFRLRARTSMLAALSLSAYSEFGLIVAAGVLPEWLVPLAIAVSVSFVVAAPLNRLAHPLVERLEGRLQRFERSTRHPDQQPRNLGDAEVLILGMGRTGSAAYRRLEEAGRRVVGLDADNYKAERQRAAGRNVLFADAEDSDLWSSLRLDGISAVIMAMDDIEAKLIAARQLRSSGFAGPIISHALFADHVERIRAAGADYTYLTMDQAGVGLAEQALQSGAPPGAGPRETPVL